MASVGHVVVGLAAARLYDSRVHPQRRGLTAVAFATLSMLPDLDVLGFRFGVPYASEFGHRGAAHSIVAGVVVGLLASALIGPPFRAAAITAVFVVVSHGLLDALTDGGEGVALLWPFSTTRFFAPWNPIPVAPIGRGFLSLRGLAVAGTELAMFAPLALYAIFGGRRRARSDGRVTRTR